MLDAATVSSGDNMHDLWRQHAFQPSNVIYPPEVVQSHDPVGSQVWTTFYVVLHPDMGLVSGPDFMYQNQYRAAAASERMICCCLAQGL